MKNKLLVVTDLGLMKAYRVEETERNTPHLETLEKILLAEAHQRFDGIVTDMAGRRAGSTGRNWGAPLSDDHNLMLEIKRRLIRHIAGHIERIVRQHESEGLWLAAHSDINRQLLDELSPAVRAMIEKNIPCDLIKAEQKSLLRHFLQSSGKTAAAAPA